MSKDLKRKILAIESTEQTCSVALSVNGEISQQLELAERKHSELLLPMIEQLLKAADLPLGDLDAIAFACGPGSFTGLRIATGVVQGLAYGAELPVVPVSSLAALAHSAYRKKAFEGPRSILVALDARMNEVYIAPYLVEELGFAKCLAEELVCSPEDVGQRYSQLFNTTVAQNEWFGAGSGWCYGDILEKQLQSISPYQKEIAIEAMDVLYLAHTLFDQGKTVSAEKAAPVYLRDTITWKKLPGR